jgi:hypothetical protein
MMRMNVNMAMETAMKVYAEEIVNALASEYSFNATEAYARLGLSVEFGVAKKVVAKVVAKVVVEEPSIPLPFDGRIREDSCSAVKVNYGLYTQCYGNPIEEGLCKGCVKQMRKANTTEPEHGYISSRQMDGYVDGKGKSPIHYTKVMKKLNLSREKVEEEAAKFGVALSEDHFSEPEMKKGRPKKEVVEVEKKSRGRPKKDEKEVEVSQTEDLFATLMQQAQSASPRPQVREELVSEVVPEVVPEVASLVSAMVSIVASDDEVSAVSSESVGTKASKKSKEEVAALKAEKEEKKRVASEAKAAKELQLAAAKAEKEAAALLLKEAKAAKELQLANAKAEKEALALLDKQEKERKVAEAKAAKELQLAEAKAAKELQLAEAKAAKELQLANAKAEKEAAAKAAKEAKALQAKAEKGSSKPSSKKGKKEEVAAPVEVAAPMKVSFQVAEPVEEEEEQEVTVVKFTHEGKTYLKSSENILYDPETQDPVGMWNEETQSIDEVELTEEEYESEEE